MENVAITFYLLRILFLLLINNSKTGLSIDRYYKKIPDYDNQIPSSGILWTLYNISKIRCSNECLRYPECIAFFFLSNGTSSSCYGSICQYTGTSGITDTVEKNGTEYYQEKSDCDKYGYSFSGYTNLCWKVHSAKKTVDAAKGICLAEGVKLITLHTSEKLKYARQFMECSANRYKFHWVGATDDINEGKWFWNNGKRVNNDNFITGQPNNQDVFFSSGDSRRNNADCLGWKAYMGWKDDNCQRNHSFICEIFLTP